MAIEPEIAEQYRRMAPMFTAMQESENATVHYHLLADALYWTDETPRRLDSSSENCLRFVLRYRTTLILGRPDRKWEEYWNEAKRWFPDWIGFSKERTAYSLELIDLYKRLEAKADAATFNGMEL